MNPMGLRIVVLATLMGCLITSVVPAETSSEKAAMKALDEFMAAFNSRDAAAWAATLNYPHARFASGTVRLWQTQKDCVDAMDFDAFAKRFNWDHSAWDSREIFQSGKDKVHIAVQFSRFDANGKMLSSYKSLYIVTKKDGHWGTQARSSFAP